MLYSSHAPDPTVGSRPGGLPDPRSDLANLTSPPARGNGFAMEQEIRFLHLSGRGPRSSARGAFVLTDDNWDDFGSRITFVLSYVDRDGNESWIGPVKIMQLDDLASDTSGYARRPVLPPVFLALGPEFISLGQEDDYYLNLRKLDPDIAAAALDALRDIAWRPQLAAPFEAASQYRNGLLRTNSAKRTAAYGQRLIHQGEVNEDQSFTYILEIEGADTETEVRIVFSEDDLLPGRVAAVIGRNAVGKTRFMSSLAADLAQIGRVSAETVKARQKRFPEGMPLFNRVIAASYSAIDRFRRPTVTEEVSYIYCGIRDDNGRPSTRALAETYAANLKRVTELDRGEEWLRYVRLALGEEGARAAAALRDDLDKAKETSAFESLSSGQAMLCHFITGLLAWIQPNTLVLFDEPETHLHPNAVAHLFVAMSAILQSYDSKAVVTTHSALVIQEIPAAHVVQFIRTGNTTVAEQLGLESFGESISELTRHVFETIEIDSLYKKTLQNLAREQSLEAALARFGDGLSLNAKSYLLAQYAQRDGRA